MKKQSTKTADLSLAAMAAQASAAPAVVAKKSAVYTGEYESNIGARAFRPNTWTATMIQVACKNSDVESAKKALAAELEKSEFAKGKGATQSKLGIDWAWMVKQGYVKFTK